MTSIPKRRTPAQEAEADHRELIEQDDLERRMAASQAHDEESDTDHIDRWLQNSGEDAAEI